MSRKPAISPNDVERIFLEHTNARGMMPMVLDVHDSRGVDLVDRKTDRTFLDFFGFYASSAVGMNHPKMRNDPEFTERLLCHHHVRRLRMCHARRTDRDPDIWWVRDGRADHSVGTF